MAEDVGTVTETAVTIEWQCKISGNADFELCR